MANEENLKPFKKGEDPRRNLNGKPKGSKSLSTIIRELEQEDFGDWEKIPIKDKAKALEIGSPWRAIVYTALAKAYAGDMKAAEWLRKSGYGDKLDLTTKGERIRMEPKYVSIIKPRDVATQTETDTSTGSDQ